MIFTIDIVLLAAKKRYYLQVPELFNHDRRLGECCISRKEDGPWQ